jgi:hypothetical protein
MFFTFIKMITCYLILRFLLTDIFNIVTSLTDGNYCKDQRNNCNQSLFSLLSSLNKIGKQNLIYILDFLNLITVVSSIVFFVYYRKLQYKIYEFIDRSLQTQDDYSLLI